MPAGLYSIVLMVAVSWLRKDTRIGPRKFLEALEIGARNSLMIVIICAAIGFVIGTFTLTGLALNLSSAIIKLSGGNFILLLIMIGVSSIILGTGMNTVAAFILVSVVAVPAMTAQGIDPFLAAGFGFDFALGAHITPPVCLAVFAGAAIARANPWETAFVAMRLGVVAYLLPFLVMFSPGLLLIGTFEDIAFDVVTTVVGAMLLISAIQGLLFAPMKFWERLLIGAASLGLLWPSYAGMGIGAALAATWFILTLTIVRKQREPLEDASRD
jgi:TRAP-type uncharacterized transport system fused permease subunit